MILLGLALGFHAGFWAAVWLDVWVDSLYASSERRATLMPRYAVQWQRDGRP